MIMLIICVLLVLFISLIVFIGVLIYTARHLTKELQLNRSLKEKEMLLSINTDGEMMDIVDKFIEDSILQYRLKYLTEKDNLYVTEKKQQEMIRTVLRDVLENMSPSLYEKMSVVYNKNRLEDIIYLKVSMAIIAFVGSINGSYKE